MSSFYLHFYRSFTTFWGLVLDVYMCKSVFPDTILRNPVKDHASTDPEKCPSVTATYAVKIMPVIKRSQNISNNILKPN